VTTNKHLELELLRLRQENSELRKALRINGRHARRIQRAYDAALMLATWHVGFLDTSRSFAMANGVSQRSWENAMALLKLARVVNGHRWRVHDLAVIESALQRAQDRALETPESFFAWCNKHGGGPSGA
jgi:hypothetical protein